MLLFEAQLRELPDHIDRAGVDQDLCSHFGVAGSPVAQPGLRTRSAAERLDMYVPIGKSRPGLVVYVHGGGFSGGDKAGGISPDVVRFVLSEGYAVASVNYRLSNEAIFPAQIQDVKAAVRWLRANASTYGYDPDNVAAIGDSAGGSLVALLATSEGVPALDDPTLGNPGVSSSIKAAIVFYPEVDPLSDSKWLSENPACKGSYDPNSPDSFQSKYLGAPVQTVPGRAKAANPITYLAPSKPVPKFLIAHGNFDCITPYQGSVELYNAIVQVADPSAAQLMIVKGSSHYPNFDSTTVLPVAIQLLHSTIGT